MGLKDQPTEHHSLTTLDHDASVNRTLLNRHVATAAHGRLTSWLISIEGGNQMQVKPQIGLTFATALRSIVRQDPDIIMIGEMRDRETAAIAVQSALIGHMVLSTLHTNDAAGSITRLLDMDVEDYLLTSTVSAVLAQRLVRTLCHHCREAYTPSDEVVKRWSLQRYAGDEPVTLYRAMGCEHCGHTGYHGRNAIVELLVMTDAIKQMVLQHNDAGKIARVATEDGMYTMLDDGLRKAVTATPAPGRGSHYPLPWCEISVATRCYNSLPA